MTGGVLASGDFNKDGKLDLVAAADDDDMPLRMLPGNGDGTFGAAIKIGGAVVNGLTFALVADFDSDGNSDVAVGYYGESDGVLIYQGLGDGTFTELIARLDTGSGSNPFGGVVADLNGDGRPDVVVANHFAQSLSIFLNQGSFAFTATDRQRANQANDVTAADLNGDGKLDVIVAESVSGDHDWSYSSGSVWVYLGNELLDRRPGEHRRSALSQQRQLARGRRRQPQWRGRSRRVGRRRVHQQPSGSELGADRQPRIRSNGQRHAHRAAAGDRR
jgi:FG-GAP-like repeat